MGSPGGFNSRGSFSYCSMRYHSMPCYYPLQAYRCDCRERVIFNECRSCSSLSLKLPCGKCIGCRLDYSAQWAIRCSHESRYHPFNCFVTLTYNDDCLPKYSSLYRKDFTDFMRVLRKKFGNGIRFFMSGEYGQLCSTCDLNKFKCQCNEFIPKLGRSHYHAILFGCDFVDRVFLKKINGFPHYTSEVLTSLWCRGRGNKRKSLGFSSVTDMSFETCAYVARYITKKVYGPGASLHYMCDIDRDTGEVIERVREFSGMSRNPGIAARWFDEFYSELYVEDNVVIGSRKMKVPRYYDKRFSVMFPEIFDDIKFERVKRSFSCLLDSTPERLRVREICKIAQVSGLVRNLG